MEIEQTLEIGHPTEAVWRSLTDLAVVADCVPGAVVSSVVDGVYHGSMTVRLGSIRASFSGSARFTEVDPVEHRVSLLAEGGGPQGRVRLLIRGTAVPAGHSATEVRLTTRVDLSGRVAQLGHGAASAVTERLVDQMTRNLERRLAGDRTDSAGRAESLSAVSLVPLLARQALADRRVRLLLTAVVGTTAGACYAWRTRGARPGRAT